MMYCNNFTACVKVSGRVLRENQNSVAVPFGAEYSIYLKNLSSVRALVRVSVDGQDATEGVSLIVPAHGDLELERFIKGANYNKGNRFKFIERTGQIEEHRGIGAEDGLIRVEYWFEAPPVYAQPIVYVPPIQYIPNNSKWTSEGNLWRGAPTLGDFNMSASGSTDTRVKESQVQANMMNFTETSARNDNGITVAGSESNQQFTYGAWFPTEPNSHVIVLKLKGAVGGQKVVQAVTVKAKITCTTCGKVNKPLHQFCTRCGTALKPVV